MNESDRDLMLMQLTKELTREFEHWESLFEHGGSDPFWSDGVNLNLTRKHILSCKIQIRELVEAGQKELSLFGTAYPDVYYRETPQEVPADYMAKASHIRQRAAQQMALYRADPNYQYILRNHAKVFPNSCETKATKEAGLSIWRNRGVSRYEQIVESGDLVAMRRDFYQPYEEKAVEWAQTAQSLKAYLESEHNPKDNVIVKDALETEELLEEEMEEIETEEPAEKPLPKPSLEQQISHAKERTGTPVKNHLPLEEQMSLF